MMMLLILLQIPFLMRLLLEFSHANAYKEPVSTLRRATNPFVLPIKGVLPLVAKRFAAEIVAVLIALMGALFYSNWLYSVYVLHVQAWIVFLQYGMFFYVIGSWIQVDKIKPINYLLHHLFEPLLRPIRKVVPPIGGVVDVSPMIFLFAMMFLQPLLL